MLKNKITIFKIKLKIKKFSRYPQLKTPQSNNMVYLSNLHV